MALLRNKTIVRVELLSTDTEGKFNFRVKVGDMHFENYLFFDNVHQARDKFTEFCVHVKLELEKMTL